MATARLPRPGGERSWAALLLAVILGKGARSGRSSSLRRTEGPERVASRLAAQVPNVRFYQRVKIGHRDVGNAARPMFGSMHELSASGRARSGRDGRPIRRRDDCARLARAACLLEMR